jgi:phosphoglycolate phosphatase-like HAD superfamily hydrolase
MKKKIIFLDGDGTLWYPSATKRTEKPHWVYHDEKTKDSYLEHIELTPKTKEALELLHKKGVCLVVISANPSDEEVAVREIKERLDHFGLSDLIYRCRASAGSDPNGKAAIMLETIQELGLSKEDALMVGDSYFYDYLVAKENGIDAFLIENDVARMPDTMPPDLQSVKEVWDLVEILE